MVIYEQYDHIFHLNNLSVYRYSILVGFFYPNKKAPNYINILKDVISEILIWYTLHHFLGVFY